MKKVINLIGFIASGFALNDLQGIAQALVVWMSIVTYRQIYIDPREWFTYVRKEQ